MSIPTPRPASDAPATPPVPTEVPVGFDPDDQIARAYAIATIAHRGELDAWGAPLVRHLQRVASRVATGPVAVCAAWLHEVVGTGGVDLAALRDAGMHREVLDAVDRLTRRPQMDDAEYFARVRESAVARAVKAAEIDDDTAPWRFEMLPPAVRQLGWQRHREARVSLGLHPDGAASAVQLHRFASVG